MIEQTPCDCIGVFPLCSYCADDLFCPQCGAQIVDVLSDYQQPADLGPIWVYPNDKHDFVVPLSLLFADARRRQNKRAPDLLIRECKLVTSQVDLFRTQVALADEYGAEYVKLLPTAENAQAKPETWYHELPDQGLSGQLHLRGDFPDKTLDLRICKRPRFRVAVDGRGVYETPDATRDWRVWHGNVWRPEELPLTLRLEAESAPVYFNEPIDDVWGETSAKLLGTVPRGTILQPGEPLELQMSVDLRVWDETNEKTLSILLPCELPEFVYIQLLFKRVSRGVVYSCGATYTIDELHFGEVVRSHELRPITVANTGEEPLTLSRPEVVDVMGTDVADWITAEFENGQQQVQLDPRTELPLRLKIDGSRLDPSNLSSDGHIAATVQIRDHFGLPWDLRVVVLSVIKAPQLHQRLAIDFGNTNTYVAIRHGKDAIPVLGQGKSAELYPSIIYFEDVSNPKEPRFHVGIGALVGAKINAAGAVTGMKRWVGVKDATVRFIRDRQGHEAFYSFADLVRFFLTGIIRQCEKERRERVRSIALTFPVKYQDARIEALRDIGNSLRSRFVDEASEETGYEVAIELDEASAVALDFLFDRKSRKEFIEPKVGQGDTSIVIGSFDFGGGTVDTALLRVTFTGPLGIGKIETRFVDFGGDSHLGGDNVTVAVMELLQSRLAELIDEEIPVVDPNRSVRKSWSGRHVSEGHENNFRILWETSERIKMSLCRREWLRRLDGDSQDSKGEIESEQRAIVEILNVEIVKLVSKSGGLLGDDTTLWQGLSEQIGKPEFLMSLEDVCRHQVHSDLRNHSGYTIGERIEKCTRDLCDAAERNNAPLDFLVLAGAGCHFPLVHDLMREIVKSRFPDVVLHYDHERPKSKVAFGAVHYFNAKRIAEKKIDVHSSTRVTRRAIGFVNLFGDFTPIIPIGVPIDSPEWFEFPDGAFALFNDDQVVQVYVSGDDPSGDDSSLHGRFLFSEAADVVAPAANAATIEPLCQSLSSDDCFSVKMAVRLNGSPQQLLLKVWSNSQMCGYWSMKPPA